MCKELGADWVPDVWENLGWHIGARNGAYLLHKLRNGRYWCSYNPEGGMQITSNGKTARGAVGLASLRACSMARIMLENLIGGK